MFSKKILVAGGALLVCRAPSAGATAAPRPLPKEPRAIVVRSINGSPCENVEKVVELLGGIDLQQLRMPPLLREEFGRAVGTKYEGTCAAVGEEFRRSFQSTPLERCAEACGSVFDERFVSVTSYDFGKKGLQGDGEMVIHGTKEWGTDPKGILRYLCLRLFA